MNISLENFKPKLKPGRMIPHGPKFTFEMQDPYDKITFPMIMADFVLLCGGQYTVREIIEKIYRKQGYVPFRAILETLYNLHTRGFLENSDELGEQPWLSKQKYPRRKLYFDFRFSALLVGPGLMPALFYVTSLTAIVASLAALVFDWQSPFNGTESIPETSLRFAAVLFFANSLILTCKHLLRGLQILSLNARVTELSIRVSPWAIYLRNEDEISEHFRDALFSFLFYGSQLLVPFAIAHVGQWLFPAYSNAFFFLALYVFVLEMNPFRRTDFFDLLRSLMLPHRLEPIAFIGTGVNPRQQKFIITCTCLGLVWVGGCIKVLEAFAEQYGSAISHGITQGPALQKVIGFLFFATWTGILFSSVHSFVETTAAVMVEQFGSWRARLVRKFKISTPVHSEKWVVEALRQLPLFAHLPDESLQRLVQSSALVWVEAGTPVIIAGEELKELYVLFEGDMLLEKNGLNVPILPVTIFGEGALMEGSASMTNIVAKDRSLCLKIAVSLLREIAHQSQVIGEVEGFVTAIMVDQFFASAPLFRKLSREGIDFLSARGALEFIGAGDVVFRQGDLGEYFYMVIRGSMGVLINDKPVKSIPQGGFFGEIALIANIPRTATVIAEEPSVLFKISAEAFWSVLVQHMEMAVFIETVGEQRLQEDLQMLNRTG